MSRQNKTKKNCYSFVHINYKSLPKRNRLSMPWVVSTAAASRAVSKYSRYFTTITSVKLI